ncbi:MAG: sigma-70 family RNA polymerase sigma factor [Fibrobacter sp.]|jgi:RNA polymerase sigma-70 factor (ECF subfamily)|nr:sigma-70 family RNA polymerase sigma factor [Fibrobacter sp.]
MEELDKITIHRAVKGEKAAFKALYDFYSPFVWRVVMRMTGDRNIAAELLQETFINVHRSLGKFKCESAVSTWIYRIAYNAVLNFANKQTRFRSHQLYDDNKFVRNETGGYEMKDLVEKVLSQLSVEERFLLVAREIDGLTFEEIESVTGSSAGALRTRLHRLKENIRNRFRDESGIREAI